MNVFKEIIFLIIYSTCIKGCFTFEKTNEIRIIIRKRIQA